MSTPSAVSSRSKKRNQLPTYWAALAAIGLASSSIYWPSGFLIVGGLVWLDLFVSNLIMLLKMDVKRRRED